jgi:hypothetical protein
MIPEIHQDLLGSPALAHVATTGPQGEVDSMAKRYRGEDGYRNERGVVLVKLLKTTKKGR